MILAGIIAVLYGSIVYEDPRVWIFEAASSFIIAYIIAFLLVLVSQPIVWLIRWEWDSPSRGYFYPAVLAVTIIVFVFLTEDRSRAALGIGNIDGRLSKVTKPSDMTRLVWRYEGIANLSGDGDLAFIKSTHDAMVAARGQLVDENVGWIVRILELTNVKNGFVDGTKSELMDIKASLINLRASIEAGQANEALVTALWNTHETSLKNRLRTGQIEPKLQGLALDAVRERLIGWQKLITDTETSAIDSGINLIDYLIAHHGTYRRDGNGAIEFDNEKADFDYRNLSFHLRESRKELNLIRADKFGTYGGLERDDSWTALVKAFLQL